MTFSELRRVSCSVLILLLCVGCGADEIDREQLEYLPTFTSRGGLTFALHPDVPANAEGIDALLDYDFHTWRLCMEHAYGFVIVDTEFIEQFRHIIVPREFKCHFHDNYCGGEYHRDPPRIYLAYDVRGQASPPMPYSWHEWRDLYTPWDEDTQGECNRGL